LRLWLEISHHAAFRVGGWAWVRADGIERAGQAGGERRVELERAVLLGLLSALKSLPPGRAVELHSACEALLAVPARLAAAEAGLDPPADNLELWAQARTALSARPVRMIRAERTPGAPAAFAAAWAELGRDRARDRGPFAAPIPRSNLAKAGL
jgi:hypothetical protein